MGVCLADPSSLSHPSLLVLEKQSCPRTCWTTEPSRHPYPLPAIMGQHHSAWGHRAPTSQMLANRPIPACLFLPGLPQPSGLRFQGGFPAPKCSPAPFTQHNSDIQGRGWVTQGLQAPAQAPGWFQAHRPRISEMGLGLVGLHPLQPAWVLLYQLHALPLLSSSPSLWHSDPSA